MCRPRWLSNAYLIDNIGFDTAEREFACETRVQIAQVRAYHSTHDSTFGSPFAGCYR